MHWLLVALILCVEFLAIASCVNTKVLIKSVKTWKRVEHDLYCGAELQTEDQWSLKILKTELVTTKNVPEKLVSTVTINEELCKSLTSVEFQFFDGNFEGGGNLSDKLTTRTWIPVILKLKENSIDTLIFSTNIELKDEKGMSSFGIKQNTNALMVIIKSTYLDKLEELLKGDITRKFDLSIKEEKQLIVIVGKEKVKTINTFDTTYILSLTYREVGRIKVLIKSQARWNGDGNKLCDLYCGAELETENEWSLKIIETELVITENVPEKLVRKVRIDGILCRALTSVEFQFFEGKFEDGDMLSNKVTNNSWIPVTLKQKKSSTDTVIFSTNVSLGRDDERLTNFRIELKDKNGMSCFGIKQNTNAIMVVISSSYKENLIKLFQDDMWLKFELLFNENLIKPSTVMVDLENFKPIKMSNTMYILNLTYWQVGGIIKTSIILQENDHRDLVSSKCYIKFSKNGDDYIGIGEIKYIKGETTMKLWIQHLWLLTRSNTVPKIEILEGIKYFSIARRKRDCNNDVPTPSPKKQWVDIYSDNVSVEVNPHILQFIVPLSLGVPEIVGYTTKPKDKGVPGFFNARTNRLTIIDKDLTNFENYRKDSLEKLLKNTGQAASKPSAGPNNKKEAADNKGFPITFKASETKASSDSSGSASSAELKQTTDKNIFIQNTSEPQIGNKNAFGFPIFQYECITG